MTHSPQRTVADYLKASYPFWDRLSSAGRETFAACSSIREYEKGNLIHSERDECLGILLVLSGQVRVYIQSEEGREVTLFRIGPGQVCTLSASCIMDEITFEILMEAVEESRILVTPICGIRRLMKENIYVENFIYKKTAEDFSEVMWSMSQMLFSSFDKRLAGYLEDERRKTGSLCISTTHDQIAKNLGSAREVVSRMLKYFEREGLVSLSRGSVTITDPQRLKALVS